MSGKGDLPRIETATAVIERRHDGIVSATAKAGTRGTLEDSIENMRAAREISAGRPMKMLIKVPASASLSPEARRFHVSPESLDGVVALALVMETRLAHSIADVVLRVCARRCPMRAFSSSGQAVDWLRARGDRSRSEASGDGNAAETEVESQALLEELAALQAHRASAPPPEEETNDSSRFSELLERVERLSADHQRAAASRDFLQSVLEAMDDAVVVLDVDQGVSFVNGAACALLDYKPVDVVGHDAGFLFGDSLEGMHGAPEKLRNVDAFMCGRDGRQIPVTINGARMKGDEGEIVATVLVARDVTELKNTERELELHRHHLQELVRERTFLLEESNQHLRRKTAVLDSVGNLLREAPKCRDLDEIAERCLVACARFTAADGGFVVEVSAEGTLRLAAPTDPDGSFDLAGESGQGLSRLIAAVVEGGKEELVEDVALPAMLAGGRGGEVRLRTLIVFPVRTAQSPWGALALTREQGSFEPTDVADVARLVLAVEESMDRKRAELALERRAEELQTANRDLSQYAHVVSHDLRTPLRAIRQYSDFLREDLEEKLDPEQGSYLDDLMAATNRADALVDDLLSFSRIGTRPTRLTSVDVGSFMESVVDGMGFVMDLSVTMPDDWPTLSVDIVPFGQVFQNLIGNAVKFNRSTPKRVELGWSRSAEGTLSFFVKDNGIGIDSRHHDKIFGVFERLHGPDDFEGTGIGLAIVHRAVSKMGGHVSIESSPGEGSTFFVHLPSSE